MHQSVVSPYNVINFLGHLTPANTCAKHYVKWVRQLQCNDINHL